MGVAQREAAAGYASQDPCGRAVESLRTCMSFVTHLTFVSVPDTLRNVVGGEAGFMILARIFAETAKAIYTRVRMACCPESSDPRLLLGRLEYVTRLIGGDGYRARAEMREDGDGAIRMVFTGIEGLRHDAPLYAAPIVGVVAGMIEAAGARARIVSDESRLHHAEDTVYRVYPARIGPGTVEVVVLPPAGRGA